MADSSGYDPKRSRVSDETMQTFQKGQVTGDITEVPGIGPAAVKKLAIGTGSDEEKITNTFQLIGKFLMFKGSTEEGPVTTREHLDRFWYYLQEVGISSHRSGIVKAIAEKVNQMMPGIYDAAAYDDDSDSDDDDEES